MNYTGTVVIHVSMSFIVFWNNNAQDTGTVTHWDVVLENFILCHFALICISTLAPYFVVVVVFSECPSSASWYTHTTLAAASFDKWQVKDNDPVVLKPQSVVCVEPLVWCEFLESED